MMRNLAGRSSKTGLTLRATGLYFFLVAISTGSVFVFDLESIEEKGVEGINGTGNVVEMEGMGSL